MSKDMKLIMESFRGFAKEIQKEAGMSDPDAPMSVAVDDGPMSAAANEINENGYVVSLALERIEQEGGAGFSAESQAKKLLAMGGQEAKRQLEPYLYGLEREALNDLSEDDITAELRYIATGSRMAGPEIPPDQPPKPAVKKVAPNIPPDQPPENPYPRR